MNPQFWLQYAIASVVLEDYDRAGRYFVASFSLARRIDGYNTFMIDNHYARFMLLQAMQLDRWPDAMNAFRDARKIVESQMQLERQRLHYPYRVAATYSNFYDLFDSRMTMAERTEIAAGAKHVLSRIERLSPERQRQRYVRDCRRAMEYVIERVEESRLGSSAGSV